MLHVVELLGAHHEGVVGEKVAHKSHQVNYLLLAEEEGKRFAEILYTCTEEPPIKETLNKGTR